MQTYYDKDLLVRTVPVLLHNRFGQKRPIPMHNGKTIDFRRMAGLATATTPLSEGVLFTDLKSLSMTNTTATVAQYGDAVGFSDLVSTTTLDPILSETVEVLAEQASETLDELHRDVLVTGTNVQYAGAATSRATIEATHIMSVDEIRQVVLTLKVNRAKKIGGSYQAIIHPNTTYDIQGTDDWKNANRDHQTGREFDGSLGRLYGVTFWESDKAKVWADAGNGSTVDVYGTLVFGKDAYGTVDLAGHNLQTIYKPLGSAGTADPLNQQRTMGWKVTMVCKILNDAFMVRIEHATSQGDNT